MGTAIKIGVIGAGSAVFSLGLIKDLCLQESLFGSTVTFMDVNPERLEMIHRLARRYAAELGVDLNFEMTVEREGALRDADFVINTAARGHDDEEAERAIGEKHGYYRGVRIGTYQHNLGLMMSVARDIERICPNAWLIQSGNPVFEGCTLMTRETSLKIVGLCHGHYGYRRVAQVLGINPDEVRFQAPGLNHHIFATHLEHQGKDLYPVLDEWIATKAEEFWETHRPQYGDNQMSRAAIDQYKLLGLMPIGDTVRILGWHYHLDLEAKKRWYGWLGGFDSEIGWAIYLQRLVERVDKIFKVAADSSVTVTQEFPPTPTTEEQVPIIDSLVNNRPGQYQVNVPNKGRHRRHPRRRRRRGSRRRQWLGHPTDPGRRPAQADHAARDRPQAPGDGADPGGIPGRRQEDAPQRAPLGPSDPVAGTGRGTPGRGARSTVQSRPGEAPGARRSTRRNLTIPTKCCYQYPC